MKIIRKIAAILVALSLSLMLFAGCQQQSAEKIDIGIIQLIENGAFNDMREGFIQQMKEKGYDDSTANFHYKNAQGDSTNLNTICQEMVDNGMDLVVTIATPASQAMVNLESDIPVMFYLSLQPGRRPESSAIWKSRIRTRPVPLTPFQSTRFLIWRTS